MLALSCLRCNGQHKQCEKSVANRSAACTVCPLPCPLQRKQQRAIGPRAFAISLPDAVHFKDEFSVPVPGYLSPPSTYTELGRVSWRLPWW